MKWLSFHGRKTAIDWKNPLWRTWASILDRLKKVLSGNGMEPIKRVVVTKKGEQVTVPCYDFTIMMLSIVNDRNIMKESNFIENFDIFTGESTIIGPMVCGDLNTSDAYVTAKRRFCRS